MAKPTKTETVDRDDVVAELGDATDMLENLTVMIRVVNEHLDRVFEDLTDIREVLAIRH